MARTLAIIALVGCTEAPPASGEPPPVDAPALVHVVPEGPFVSGDAVTLSVEATDPDGVREVSLRHRVPGAADDQKTPLHSDDGITWSTEIALRAPGLDYWFRAYDDSDFLASADLPEAGTFGIAVESGALPVPFEEGFDAATSELDLYVLGWTEAALGDSGQEWALSQLRSASPPWAVRHRRGVDDGSFYDDWLVSPVLDLSSLTTAQLTWQEHGSDVALAAHSLWVSTGSSDPTSGAFSLARELEPPPEDDWGRSVLVDLSAWAGEPRVTLAWRYEGTHADEWTIDDVRVEALGPDLHLVSLAQSPLSPGDTGELTLVLANEGAPAAAITLVGEAGSVFFSGAVAPGPVTVPIAIDAAVPDDSLLPVTFTATADGRTFVWSETLLVGDPAIATVGFELDDTGFLEVFVGDDVTELTAFAGVLGPQHHTILVDLTGFGTLPPGPAQRWHVRVDGEVPGAVTDFTIASDGIVHVGDDLGSFDGEATFWLPARPEPVVSWSGLDPVLLPGGAARWELVLDNVGGATVGPTTLALSSPDGSLAFDTALFDLGSDWTGSFTTETGLTVTDVRDSRPVPVDLVVTDTLESFVVSAELPVPWPVLALTGAAVDGDGLLDPGESAALTLTVANIGDLATGPVSCALTGDLDVLSGAVDLDLAPDTSATASFDVTLSGGAAGDALAVALTCGEHVATGVVLVGEPQWTWLTELPDAYGDAVDGYAFDVHHARWRVVDDRLELEVVSDAPFDPGAVLVEGWMTSPYAGWDLYQVTAVAGVGTLRGYTLAAWWVLDPPVVTTEGDTLRLELDLTALGLTEDTLQIGLAAGFCGGVAYFCDHYPDGWGDPYQAGLVTSLWPTVGW